MRAGHLHHLGTAVAQPLDGLGEAGLDGGVVALTAELLDHADPQPPDLAAARRLRQRGQRLRDGRGVHGVVAAHDCVQQRGVQDVAGDGAGLVQAGGHRHHPVARHPAVGGFHPDGAGHGPGLADGTAGVGAQGERGEAARHRSGGSSPRAAGNPAEVPRVSGGSEGGGLGGGAHRELVHVGLAEDDQPGLFEARDDRRVVGRDPALQDAGAAGGGHPGGAEVVLHGDGDPCQRAEFLAFGPAGVDLGRGGQGAFGVDVQECVEGRVHRLDLVEVGAGQFDGTHLARREQVGLFVGRSGDDLGHGSVLAQDPGNTETLILDVGGSRQRRLLGQGFAHPVGAHHVGQRKRVGHEGDVITRHLAHPGHGAQDHFQFGGQFGAFRLGQFEPGQRCQPRHLLRGQGHGFS